MEYVDRFVELFRGHAVFDFGIAAQVVTLLEPVVQADVHQRPVLPFVFFHTGDVARAKNVLKRCLVCLQNHEKHSKTQATYELVHLNHLVIVAFLLNLAQPVDERLAALQAEPAVQYVVAIVGVLSGIALQQMRHTKVRLGIFRGEGGNGQTYLN